MIELPDNVLLDIKKHAENSFPKESCGVLIVSSGKYRYIACENIAEDDEQFIIKPSDYATAEDIGTPVCIVHSHPNIPPTPSQADLVSCERSGLPWLIVNWPVGTTYYFEPTGYKAPLVGRVFATGVLDCYTIIEDYYKDKLGIILPSFPTRTKDWFEKGENLYLDNVQKYCIEVDTPKLHDVLLMRVGSPVPNHAAIWLGDGTILHHQIGRLSSIDVYGGWYRKITSHIFRHKDLV